MIDLYFTTSPNVYKVIIALEEMALDYRLIWTDLGSSAQLNPGNVGGAINGKLPVIVDSMVENGGGSLTLFESGAILQYLAEKCGRFLAADVRGRTEIMQWLFWQMGGIGPFGGQCFHFRAIAPVLAPGTDNAYSKQRYGKIFSELLLVMNRRLEGRAYLAGDYSIADMACFPWIEYLPPDEGREAFPNVERWRDAMANRPAVRRAYEQAGKVDIGHDRNELGTAVFSAAELARIVTL